MQRNAKNVKRPLAEISTTGVNWCANFVHRERKSSPSRTRTYDLAINSRALYQLSYRGKENLSYDVVERS